MEDLNKISSTRVGDNIHFYVNGQEDKGTVVKMDTSYVTVLKDDGNFQDIHINETFFIKDILLNKTWNDMNMEERTVKLHEIKAYSPRFLAKSWQELPRELKIVLEDTAKDAQSGEQRLDGYGKRDNALPAASEQSHSAASAAAKRPASGQGTIDVDLAYEERNRTRKQKPQRPDYDTADSQNTGAPAGEKIDDKILTDIHSDWEADEISSDDKREYKSPPRGGKSPKDMETKKSNVEQGHLGSAGRASHVVETNIDFDAPDDYEGQTEDEKKEQFKHEDKKPQTTNKTLQEQLWEDWLNKESMGGGDSSPAQTSITTGTTGMYNAVYGKDGRIKGQEKDKDEEKTEKDKEDKEKERKG